MSPCARPRRPSQPHQPERTRRGWRPAFPALLGLLIFCGCGEDQHFRATPWVWTATADGRAQNAVPGNPGSRLRFDEDLDMDQVAVPAGLDLELADRKMTFALSASYLNMEGRHVFTSPRVFGGRTYGGAGPEVVRSDLDLVQLRATYIARLWLSDNFYLAADGSFELVDYDFELQGAGQSGRLNDTAPVFMIGLHTGGEINEQFSFNVSGRALTYPRIFGFDEGFFEIRGEYVEYRADLIWHFSEHAVLRGSWISFLEEIEDAEGDVLAVRLHGPAVGLQLRF
jgi:hypothetical protein